jgi:hypothetical protein
VAGFSIAQNVGLHCFIILRQWLTKNIPSSTSPSPLLFAHFAKENSVQTGLAITPYTFSGGLKFSTPISLPTLMTSYSSSFA